jgi:hypothetical protein
MKQRDCGGRQSNVSFGHTHAHTYKKINFKMAKKKAAKKTSKAKKVVKKASKAKKTKKRK